MEKITTIVLTGGPCAGKTSALPVLSAHLESKGHTVLCIPESATELISGGVSPSTCKERIEYMIYQTRLQLLKEDIFRSAALHMDCDSIVILCDRGIMDILAYMDITDFQTLMDTVKLHEDEILARYDAVIHLESVAVSQPSEYSLNNSARSESIEQAILLDQKTQQAWKNHPRHAIIPCNSLFEDKIQRLVRQIMELL